MRKKRLRYKARLLELVISREESKPAGQSLTTLFLQARKHHQALDGEFHLARSNVRMDLAKMPTDL